MASLLKTSTNALGIGMQLFDSGNWQDALRCFKRLHEICNNDNDQRGIEISTFFIGKCFLNLSKHKEAIECFNKFLCYNVTRLQADVYCDLGCCYLGLKDYNTAKEYIDRSLRIAKDSDIGIFYHCNRHLADLYHGLSQYAKSLDCCKETLKFAKEISSEKEGYTYDRMGKALASLDRMEEAIDCYNKVLKLAQESGDKDKEKKAYDDLGSCYSNLGHYDKVKSCLEKVIEIAKEIGHTRHELIAYKNMFHLCSEQGNPKQVIESHRKYLEVKNNVGGEEKEEDALGYRDLGNAFTTAGMYGEALKYYEKSNERHSISRSNIGVVYGSCGEPYKAIQCFQKQLDTAMKAGKVNMEIYAYFNLAAAYKKLNWKELAMECQLKFIILAVQTGDKCGEIVYYQELGDFLLEHGKLNEAIKCHTKALKMATKFHKTTFVRFGSGKLAEIYLKLGKHDEAIKFFKSSLTIAVENGDKNNEARYNASVGVAYRALAQHHKARSECTQYNQAIELAEVYMRDSIKCWDEVINDLREYQPIQISLLDTTLLSFKNLTSILIETNQTEEALLVAEHGRARALEETLVSKYFMKHQPFKSVTIHKNDLKLLLADNTCLLFTAFTLQNEFYYWVLSKQPTVCITNKVEHNNVHITLQTIDRLICLAFNSIGATELNAVCEDRSLVSVGDHGKSHQSHARNNANLRNPESTSSGHDCDYDQPLKELFELIITPIKQHLTEDEIVVVPEVHFHLVPFAALLDPDSGRFLCETKRIRLAPSLTTLKILKECSDDYHSKKGALVIGNPLVGEVMFRGENKTFSNLPFAAREAGVFSSILSVSPLIGIDANKDAVKERLQEDAAVIHIAAHGDDTTGEIALAPGISAQSKAIPEEEDYILTMQEVQEIGVRAKLVVLSCCHSGRGEIRTEGVVGMARAFVAAGARAVVASLWAIDDEATLDFMAGFYMHLRRGRSASVSLNESMKELIREKKYSHPKYWAPFFLIGDDVTIF